MTSASTPPGAFTYVNQTTSPSRIVLRATRLFPRIILVREVTVAPTVIWFLGPNGVFTTIKGGFCESVMAITVPWTLYVVLASAGRRGQENRNKTQMINHGRVFMMTLYQALRERAGL